MQFSKHAGTHDLEQTQALMEMGIQTPFSATCWNYRVPVTIGPSKLIKIPLGRKTRSELESERFTQLIVKTMDVCVVFCGA